MEFSFFGILKSILEASGFAGLIHDPRYLIMIAISCLLLYMGIVKKYEPLLLVTIAFGILMSNFPYTGILDEGGLFYYFYFGIEKAIYPSIIFLGIGAMTDFGPLIARPSSLLLGAAAQLGIFAAFL
ncbi:MAG: sodium ion-translocating decarboxylase subunit beta, partial [Clostridia bacterium]